MVPTNFWVNFLIALVPLAVGAVYYGPLFGKLWQREAGVTDEQMQNANMLKIFGLTYLYSFLFVTFLPLLVVHQTGLSGLFGMLPEWAESGSALWQDLNLLDEKWGMYSRHLHFGHGALHGVLGALFIVAPVICINGLFERKSWKYMLIHVGYWIIIMALMGGLVCQFLNWPLPL
ncbi:DUF1761 domain-containing protein [Neolewinella persica]|uniref:DUF1761 domain-containing protein n=1 Tax=Neolewinella persica TaxID=70998 RepID=UPI00036AC6E1|nr:DUF1761 domain-containing protein [Neolewinella persica]